MTIHEESPGRFLVTLAWSDLENRQRVKAAGFQWAAHRKSWVGTADNHARLLASTPADAPTDELAAAFPSILCYLPAQTFGVGTFPARWEAKTEYSEREIPKAAGFRWDSLRKVWWTDKYDAAERYVTMHPRGRNDKMARARAQGVQVDEARIALSRATDGPPAPAPEGCSYLPYQLGGIHYILTGPEWVLLGDDMGLGKTIQAIGVINSIGWIKRVLLVCPASLKINWSIELRRWLTRPLRVGFAEGDRCPHAHCDLLIINYDLLDRHKDKLRSVEWDMMICDEAHYLKNPKAKRTIALLGQPPQRKVEEGKTINIPAVPKLAAKRAVFATGTPIPNKPIEIFPIVQACGFIRQRRYFIDRYCNGSADGASNLDELQAALRSTIMVRRIKADVLKDLPPKRRIVIEMEASGDAAAVVRAESAIAGRAQSIADELAIAQELAKFDDDYNEAVARLRADWSTAFEDITRARHEVALAAAPTVTKMADDMVSEVGKLIIFAHHRDVIATIINGLTKRGRKCVSVTGDTSMSDRHRAVTAFQEDPEVDVFVGNIQAAGVGLTLVASSTVLFAELDWVPGNVTQAEDRAHRIGQRDSVTVYHAVLQGSIQATMAKRLIEKQAVIDAALNDRTEAEAVARVEETAARVAEAFRDPADTAATAGTERKALDEIAETLTADEVERIHQGLRLLADLDGDRATVQNGVGFSRIDGVIGHRLARCEFLTPRQAAVGKILVTKYRRQLATL